MSRHLIKSPWLEASYLSKEIHLLGPSITLSLPCFSAFQHSVVAKGSSPAEVDEAFPEAGMTQLTIKTFALSWENIF